MSQHKNILDNLRGHTQAMYSTWIQYRPARLLFDAGEGVSLAMRNTSFSIENILLSHGHYDHIGGIPGLLYSRASARGDKEKAITIHHPGGWEQIEALKKFVEKTSKVFFKYDLVWNQVVPGQVLTLGVGDKKTVDVRVFPVDHVRYASSVGYALVEKKMKLKREFKDMTKEEIEAMAKAGRRGELLEEKEKILLAYCGDSAPVDLEHVWQAEVIIHEGTFADHNDRKGIGHSSILEAVEVAKDAEAPALILIHVSGRYTPFDVDSAIEAALLKTGYNGLVRLLAGSRKYDFTLGGVVAGKEQR